MKLQLLVSVSIVSLLLFNCSKKKEEAVPTEPEIPQPVEHVCVGNKTTNVVLDAAASYKKIECSVSTTQGSDTLYLDVKGSKAINYLYITVSKNNGPARPFVGDKVLLTEDKKSITPGIDSSYSYQVPSLASFKLKIPVSLQSQASAFADIYTIWATSSMGHFSVTGKRRVVGPVTTTLKYNSGISFVSVSGLDMGDQTSLKPNLLSLEGKVGAVTETNLFDASMSFNDKQAALNSVDLSFMSVGAGDTIYGNASSGCGNTIGAKTILVGTGLRKKLGQCVINKEVSDSAAKVALYQGNDFDVITGDGLQNLPLPTNERVDIVNNGVYVFQTSDGKKGLVRVRNYTKSPGELKAKMLVDVKVLLN